MRKNKSLHKKLGIFGGTFDPPHKGHYEIATSSIKKLKLDLLIWAITKKNPLKNKPVFSLKKRTLLSKKIIKNNNKIKIKSYDNIIKTNKTINLINFLKKKNKNTKLYFIMGSDNLEKLHKWHSWRKIAKLSKIVIFPRQGYKNRFLKCKAYKMLKKDIIIFLNSKITNISSSKIRKNYLL